LTNLSFYNQFTALPIGKKLRGLSHSSPQAPNISSTLTTKSPSNPQDELKSNADDDDLAQDLLRAWNFFWDGLRTGLWVSGHKFRIGITTCQFFVLKRGYSDVLQLTADKLVRSRVTHPYL
jgi:hypothetical protein